MEDTNNLEYNWIIEYQQPQKVVKVVSAGLFSVDRTFRNAERCGFAKVLESGNEPLD